MKDKIATSRSFNILTWQQVMAPEIIDVIILTNESTFKEMQSVQKNSGEILENCTLHIKEIHDAKYCMKNANIHNGVLNNIYIFCVRA